MPELSVIVVFDVTEARLGDCLASLRRQDHPDFEVLLAPYSGAEWTDVESDDGEARRGDEGLAQAGDDEAHATRAQGLELARAAALQDPTRMRLLPEVSATAAAARAAAVELADGEFVLFLPGADALVGYALGYLARALRDSGSDIAAGGVHRFNGLGIRRSSTHRGIYTTDRRATTVVDQPALLSDRLWGNKLMRRELWQSVRDHDAEDDGGGQLVVARAWFAASAIDMLPGPAYLRRDGAPAPDLAQGAVVNARMGAVARLSAELTGRGRARFDSAMLRGDLWQLMMRLDGAGPETRQDYCEALADYLDAAEPEARGDLGPLRRLCYHLAGRGDVDRLLECLTFAKSVEREKAPVVRRGVHHHMRYPFFDDPAAGVPREVYRVGKDLQVRQKTERVVWQDGALVLSGRLGIPRFPARYRWQQHVRAQLVDELTGERRRVSATVHRAAEYRLPDVPDAARHDYGGFAVRIPAAKLLGASAGRARWRVELTVFNRGVTRRRRLANPVAGAPRRPGYQRIASQGPAGELWARPDWDVDGELLIAVEPVGARLTGYGYADGGDGEVLELRGELSPAAGDARELRLTRLPGTAELSVPVTVAGGRFTAAAPIAELLRLAVVEGEGDLRQERWSVELCDARGERTPVVLPDEVEPRRRSVRGDSEREVAVERSTSGYLRLRAGWSQPAIEEARWDGRRLVLSGHHQGLGELALVFSAQGRNEEHLAPCERDGTRFRAVFDPVAVPTLSGELSLAAGGYEVWGRYRGAGNPGQGTDVRAVLAPELIAAPPAPLRVGPRGFEFTALGSGAPVLRVSSDLTPEERGTYAQWRLREDFYPRQRDEPVRPGILFDSYTGRQCSDSPHGVFTELRRRGGRWQDYPMDWLVADGRANVPEGCGHIRHRGREFYERLARSEYIVTNSRLPAWFHRREGQVVVQTWHGSMLKRIGFDVDNMRGKARDYHEKLAWETAQWDYLVSPSPWATPILRRAFRFDGEILETGYPRNDIFFAPDREERAARVRRTLGIPDGKRVVLYAPTWRDDQYYTRGKHKLDLRLDIGRMREVLGEDHVLLIRPHPRVVDRVPGDGFVQDASHYPEVMELFLITDVLVTDYSSMMFDFANTGRPMLFFTYDLESYRDELRGFYFDFAEQAPGPLLQSGDEVIEALRGIDDVAQKYAESYAAFVARFCPLDDGGAAARVVDHVFEQRG